MSFFSVQGLTKRFGGLTALDDVSFEVEKGSIFSVIGPNGSGKSTAFNCINGIYKPTAGSIHFQGNKISGLSPSRIARMGLARTFQNIELFASETTVDNLMLGRHQHMSTGLWRGMAMLGRRTWAAREEIENREHVEQVLETLELKAVRNRPVSELPYGTQKRVELGRALAMEPLLLLVDEPVAGMNPIETAELTALIGRLRSEWGFTIVMIEHDMKVVRDVSDRVVVLDHGVPIAQGSYEEVSKDPNVIEAYLGRPVEAKA